ncbi:MAG TPA: thioredoxin-like domain-containing protein [Nitrospiraceae bacterium]|nr:thioredoxin-like domain-containing protein [Nitrospiraceae bacterium]
MTGMWLASYVALWIVVAVLVMAVLVFARQIGLLHRRLPPLGARMENAGPEIGTEPPPVTGLTTEGRPVRLGHVGGKRSLLVFVSPTCEVCRDLAPAVRSLERSERSRLDLLLVSIRGNATENRSFIRQHKLDDVPLIVSPELGDEYRIPSTPYAVLVDRDGLVRAKGIVNNLEHLESLLNAAEMGHPSVESLIHARHHEHDISEAVRN